MKSILVTGGAGFIGANFVPYFAKKYADYQVINLDKLTYAGNLDNLSDCADCPNYKFVQGDICDRELIESCLKKMIFAALFILRRKAMSIIRLPARKPLLKPMSWGLLPLLDVARNYWMSAPHQFKPGYEDCRFHHISTDEVYGALGIPVSSLKQRHMIRVLLIRHPRPVRI